MQPFPGRLPQTAALSLVQGERRAVLGDLKETGRDLWSGLPGVLGLVVRRHRLKVHTYMIDQ
jgi:hypothetical protein